MRAGRFAAAVGLVVVSIGAFGAAPVAAAPLDADWVHPLPATAPPARLFQAMAYDSARQETVMFGGYSPVTNGSLGDTWVWDGTDWTQRFPVHSPPARHAAMATFDGVHQRVVLFGGISTSTSATLADTWIWDGTDWAIAAPATSPSARASAAFAYDAAHGEAVLFGGFQMSSSGVGSKIGDTWTWDGTTWTPRAPGAAPVYRDSAMIGYDAGRGEIVLFGGLGGPGNFSKNDTWTWDGAEWTLHNPAHSPPVLFEAASGYDDGTSRFIVFGGYSDAIPGFSSDTWAWDGSDWAKQSVASAPSARYAESAYDGARHQLVLFGGGTGAAASETWLHVTAPGAPTQVTAYQNTAGDGSALVSFAPPTSDGGRPITGYGVTCSAAGGATGSTSTPSSPVRVRGLTNGLLYTCAVTATNSVGTGDATTVSGVTPRPTVSIGDASVLEGDSGTRVLRFPVTLSRPLDVTVTVPYAVTGLDATGAARPGPGVDVKARTGLVTFATRANGLTPVSKTVSVTVYGDVDAEGDELVQASLAEPSEGVQVARSVGVGSILDDEGSGVRAGVGDAAVVEGNAGQGRKLVFAVTLSGPSTAAITIPYTVSSLDATYDKKATASSDFGGSSSGVVSFPLRSSGTTATAMTVAIPVWADERVEPDETVVITLETPTGPVNVIRAAGSGSIVSDD